MCPSSPRSSGRIVVPVTPCKENARLAEILGENYLDHRTYSVAEAWDELTGKIDLILNDEIVSTSRRRQVMKLILELKRAHLKADGVKSIKTRNVDCASCPRCANTPALVVKHKRFIVLKILLKGLRVALSVGGGMAIGSKIRCQPHSAVNVEAKADCDAGPFHKSSVRVQEEVMQTRGENKIYADRILRRNASLISASSTFI